MHMYTYVHIIHEYIYTYLKCARTIYIYTYHANTSYIYMVYMYITNTIVYVHTFIYTFQFYVRIYIHVYTYIRIYIHVYMHTYTLYIFHRSLYMARSNTLQHTATHCSTLQHTASNVYQWYGILRAPDCK